MSQIKVILVEIRSPQNYKGGLVITPNGVYKFHGSDGAAHMLEKPDGKMEMKSFGKLYQMVGYDPTQSEENQFLPIAEDQWKLCTKFVQRNRKQELQAGLAPFGSMPYNLKWQNARLDKDGYRLFKTVNIKKE